MKFSLILVLTLAVQPAFSNFQLLWDQPIPGAFNRARTAGGIAANYELRHPDLSRPGRPTGALCSHRNYPRSLSPSKKGILRWEQKQ
ncbi:MAG: hypothetical protein OSB05_09715 [Akkermansiaceae bacterium]|nr:hypothetical protein [Akkermansiaceae bacterium]